MSAQAKSSAPRILLVEAPSNERWAERVSGELMSRVPGIEIYIPDAITSPDKLKEEIDAADLILMLVSSSFMASPIFKLLMDQLDAFEAGFMPPPTTTWILVDYVPWQQTPLREYESAIPPDEPLASMVQEEFQIAMERLAGDLTNFLAAIHDPHGAAASPPLPPPESSQFVSPPSSAAPFRQPMGASPPWWPPSQHNPLTSPPETASPPLPPSGPSSVPLESPPFARGDAAGGPSQSESPPRDATIASRVAGFRPDSVKGQDRLSIRPEALTLAMVLAHKDVEPPISVGLFGDWGSGKSFFMREMKLLIDGLSRRSRDGKGRFCENIVQLDFNAWDYMDSDLWASLAREIFEGLATAVAEKEKQPGLDLERERLRLATQSTKDLIAATETQVVEVQKRMDETQRQLNTVQREQDSVKNVSVATAIAVLQMPEVEKELREVAGSLGIDQASKNIGELKEQVVDLTATGRRGRALLAGMKERWVGLVLGLGFSVAVAFVLYEVLQQYSHGIALVVARIAALTGVLTAALSTVGSAGKAILRRAESFKESFDANLKSQKAAREREIRLKQQSLEEEHQKLEAQWIEQQKELERLKTLSRKLGELDSSRQLVDFIRARDASSDYRSKLGTIARASQDFKRLSDLMARAAQARKRIAAGLKSAQDEEDARLPRIDRIVLYIDDLDRCPTNKVVDVLQAVHLLLAYPLFVVVVGVDPRWLLHSLEEHSGAFRFSENSDDNKHREDWRSTSLDYLEKIFQIPYTLRPMSPDGFAGLMSDLSGSSSTREGAVSSPPISPPRQPSTPSSSMTGDPSTTRVPSSPPLERREMSPAAGSPASISSPPRTDDLSLDPNPGALELDPRERDFMKQLYELIPTPRAAKRFVNIYRLIRASITSELELKWFLDGREFMSVQVLLAMVTGAPAEASVILRKLLALPTQAPWTVNWWDLVDGVVKEGGEEPSWKSFAMRLQSLRESGQVPGTCEGFRKWADDVARYSFYSGRVLLGPQLRSPVPPEPKS